MAKVLGVGGIFFKSPDTQRLYAWYKKYRGNHQSKGIYNLEQMIYTIEMRINIIYNIFRGINNHTSGG